ncbi:MAG: hypothetical protein WDZ85_00305 [Candidatus Paceibacterota bacterium]
MKIQTNNLALWEDAHVSYEIHEHDIGNKDSDSKIKKEDNEWRHKLLTETPNGNLLLKNSFFNDLKSQDKVYLAHVTPNLHNIQDNGVLYPSAGCLVGSIYCTPVFMEEGKLRMHNLGEFIFNKEMPLFTKFIEKRNQKPLEIIVFEIDLPTTNENNLVGVDYLRLGNVHFDTYKALEYLLSPHERSNLQEICTNRVRRAFNYLYTCNQIHQSNTRLDSIKFLEMFINAIDHLPILGYFYFEVLTEYIMLFQDNRESQIFSKLGEFYSPSYKELIFYLCPHLSRNFSLGEFKPTLKGITRYIKKRKIIKNFDENTMFEYLTRRLVFLTNARLFSEDTEFNNWKHLKWEFDDISGGMDKLLGHLIHRELRNFGRYPYFYFYFEQHKALSIWNYWNYLNIAIPFNGIIPKGEVGINPAYPDLKYKTYSTEIVKENGYSYLNLKEELDLDIAPKLVDYKFTSMRNRCKNHGKTN